MPTVSRILQMPIPDYQMERYSRAKELKQIAYTVAAKTYRDYFKCKVEIPRVNHDSISCTILEHQGRLAVSDSIWAPWSINYKNK